MAVGFLTWHSLHHSDVRLNRKERQRLMREYNRQDQIKNLDDPFGKA